MCGFAGFVDGRADAVDIAATIARMTSVMVHRGPDDAGYWVDPSTGVALGHRRLSIVDLSPGGHQPMTSASGRYVIVYNGEVYNHRALRRELAADAVPASRGHSDTEVILQAIEHWGLRPALERFVGMFAFALWDRSEHVMHLVRDRLGEKPLYYGWVGGAVAFASELKALAQHPAWERRVDPSGVALLMRFGYIPGPHSIYRDVLKLPAGCLVSISGDLRRPLPAPTPYWSAKAVFESGARVRPSSDESMVQALDDVLRTAVADQMVADVPVGAFLSGGVDSALIVSLMQAQSRQPIRTFTIGSHDKAYDEADGARRIAEHLGTAHTELYVTPDDAMDIIPRLPSIYDEPFADPSQIPTYLVSRLARQQVTVSLSGDGGDELFCGYHRYQLLHALWRRVAWIPHLARPAVARSLATLDPVITSLERRESSLPRVVRRFAIRMPRRARWLTVQESPDSLYGDLLRQWEPAVMRGDPDRGRSVGPSMPAAALAHPLERAMFVDLTGYLPDDILVKVDRASMAVSLESRAPFLDHRVVEFAARVPLALKWRDGQSKWLLRQLLRRYLPDSLVAGTKRGFLVGFGHWLRGPLRDWTESLLNERQLREDGFFDAGLVRAKWRDFCANDASPWSNQLWIVLMFQSWLRAAPVGPVWSR